MGEHFGRVFDEGAESRALDVRATIAFSTKPFKRTLTPLRHAAGFYERPPTLDLIHAANGERTLSWKAYPFKCGDADTVAAKDIDPNYVVSLYTIRFSTGWGLESMYGLSTKIEKGVLTVPCGTANGFAPGTEGTFLLAYR